MYTIQNLTNSPYKIGNQIIPAHGTLEGVEVSDTEIQLIKLVGCFKIDETAQTSKRGRKPKQETGSDETETRDNDEAPSE